VKVSDSQAFQPLLLVLSITAGCTDTVGFLRLNGLFIAQITGNLVILAAHLVSGSQTEIARMLAVPVFIVVISLATVLAGDMESRGVASIRLLLMLQFLLLASFFVVCVVAARSMDPNAKIAILAGMLGVSAMAVQHTLVQFSLKGSPATAVMTSNVTRFAISIGEILRGGSAQGVAEARNRVVGTLPVIVGFTVGCAIGAGCETALGIWSLALPAGLGLIALAMGYTVEPDRYSSLD
jgi:uncharacterized membrane protein YoaK (UPF0700 family)